MRILLLANKYETPGAEFQPEIIILQQYFNTCFVMKGNNSSKHKTQSYEQEIIWWSVQNNIFNKYYENDMISI